MSTVKDRAYDIMAAVADRGGLVLDGWTMRQPRISSLCRLKMKRAYEAAEKATRTGRKSDLEKAKRHWASAQRCTKARKR